MTSPSTPTGTSIADPSTVDWLGHHAADALRVADTGGDDVEGDCFLAPGFSEALAGERMERCQATGYILLRFGSGRFGCILISGSRG